MKKLKNKKEIIYTDRLVLKAFTERDETCVIDMLYHDEIRKTYMVPDFTDRKLAEELFQKLYSYSRSDAHFVYGIYRDEDLIGFINECDIEEDNVELGYVIHPRYKGNGYATEALSACIKELHRVGFERITAGFFEENAASRRVMEKSGMQPMNREEDITYRGLVHHCLYYGHEEVGFTP